MGNKKKEGAPYFPGSEDLNAGKLNHYTGIQGILLR